MFGSSEPMYDGLVCHVHGFENSWSTLFSMIWVAYSLDRQINGLMEGMEKLISPTMNSTIPHLLDVLDVSRLDLADRLGNDSTAVDVQCSFGQTPLCWAAQEAKGCRTVQVLVSHGATIHIADIRDQTPTLLSAETGHYTSLQVLLEATPRLRGQGDYNPAVCEKTSSMRFDDVGNNKNDKNETNLVRVENVSPFCLELLEKTDYKGRAAIHFAARTNNIRQAALLLRYGADLGHPDACNRLPLFIALYWITTTWCGS